MDPDPSRTDSDFGLHNPERNAHEPIPHLARTQTSAARTQRRARTCIGTVCKSLAVAFTDPEGDAHRTGARLTDPD